jgi:hypothetical protein
MNLFTIILKDDVAVDPRKYGALLAPVLGVTVVEAKMAVRRGRGIFVEDVSEEHARRLAEALRADGIDSWCLPNGDLPALATPRRVTQVERTEDALRFYWAGGAAASDMAWRDLAVVSLGAVALPEFRDRYPGLRFDHMPAFHRLDDPATRELLREKVMLRMGESESRDLAPASPKPKADDRSLFEELQKKRAKELRVYADLVSADGARWLRIPADEVAYLHQVGSVRLGEAYGFHQLAMELARRCPDARTDLTRRFVPGADVNELVFQTLEDFTRYTAWNAIRNRLWQDPALSSPSPAPPGPPTDNGSSKSSPEPGPTSI